MKIPEFEFKTFGMTVKNDTDKTLTFALTKGTFPNLAEIKRKYADVDAILADGIFYTEGKNGEATTEVGTCTVDGASSMAHFQEFFSHAFEGEIYNMEMVSTEKGNFYDTVQAVVPSPFEAQPTQVVNLSQYLDPGQFDQTRILADQIRIPLSPMNMVLFRIRKHSEINFTFTINAWPRTHAE